MLRTYAASLILILLSAVVPAQEEKKPVKPADQTVEQLAASCKKSVVVITVTGRDGKREGLGTGFVVSADGLIATNLHVIGEARPIVVQTADGKKHDVVSVHATDRSLDLALLKIDAKDLTPLPLGDADKVPQGAQLVALGNPQGLEHSVVAGVLSGRREIDGRNMLQMAMPIEPGNSGGPVLDLQGRVQGIVTMKSAVTNNLGFAVPINGLKPLLEKPNPVAMAKWLTIGALDAEEWEPLFGARWRQHAGRITVEQAGSGFGGRSLLLCKRPVPELPFEVAVTVRLDDEAGAAGIAFHADGKVKHYGFYPTAGGLRFTRFEGPDVFTWKVLWNDRTVHYRPGQWNTIKVRVEKEKILCYVNDQLVHESNDTGLASGQIGLCKFRETRAEFKGFRIAKQIPVAEVPAEAAARIAKAVAAIKDEVQPDLIDKLAPDSAAAQAILRDQARKLEEQAARLRQLAAAVHRKRIVDDLVKVMQAKESDVDLVHAALLIARLDNDELDVDAYRQEVDRIARKIAAALPKDADEKAKLAALNNYLFTERGYHGSRGDYYNKSNSYLNEVIDDREGLPITLSVLYIELARRIGLRMVGVPLPGHFVVRTVPAEGEGQLIDVYDQGKALSRADAAKKVEDIAGIPLADEHLKPAAKKSIALRMLHNLLNIARRDRDTDAMLRYLDAIVGLAPDAAEERFTRAYLRANAGQKQAALEDIDWLIEKGPEGLDKEKLLELRRMLK